MSEQDPKPLPRPVEKLLQRKESHKEKGLIWRATWAGFGFLVLLTGLAMVVMPGPAVVVIPIGLAILSLEFIWAEQLLEKSVRSGMNFQGWLKDTIGFKRLLLTSAAILATAAMAVFLILV